MNVHLKRPGWCVNFMTRGAAPGEPTVESPGRAEQCVRCLARELGLPESATADDLAAELARRV